MKRKVEVNPLKETNPGFSLGKLLAQYRQKEGLSQAELANLLDTNRNTIVNWEKDKTQPDFSSIRALVQILSIPLYELFNLSSAFVPNPQERILINLYRKLSSSGQECVDALVRTISQQEDISEQRALYYRFRVLPRESSPAAAGIGCPVGDCPPEPIFVTKNSISDKADSILRVSGNSMYPVYNDGDYVYLKYTNSYEDGDDVICVYNEGIVIKRAFNGELYSINKDVPFGKHYEDENIRVLAKVIGTVRNDELPTKAETKKLPGLFVEELREFDKKFNRD